MGFKLSGSRMTLMIISLNIIALAFTTFSEAQSQKVPAMYVFGDSIVDVGNNNYLKLSIAKADFPHNGVDYPGQKPTGRFSNGKNSADFLAEKVGLVTPPPYLSLVSNSTAKSNTTFPITGVSFASGGAGIFNASDDSIFKQSIPLSKQVEYYSTSVYEDLVHQLGSAGAQQHLSQSLFAVVIGSNDILGYFSSGSNLPKQSTAQQRVDSMLVTLQQNFKSMHNFGARKFVVTGIGAVGCCPSQRNQNTTEECNEEANYWSAKYNEGLKSMLQGLKSELTGMAYSYLDIYSVFVRFIQTPATYGFTEIKAACCGLGNLRAQVPCVPNAPYCSNRSDHVFWDLYHPTEAAARILVDTVFDGSQHVVPTGGTTLGPKMAMAPPRFSISLGLILPLVFVIISTFYM